MFPQTGVDLQAAARHVLIQPELSSPDKFELLLLLLLWERESAESHLHAGNKAWEISLIAENANDSDWRNHGNMGGRVETTGGQLCIVLIFSNVAPPLLMRLLRKIRVRSLTAGRLTLCHSANFNNFVVTFLKTQSKAS